MGGEKRRGLDVGANLWGRSGGRSRHSPWGQAGTPGVWQRPTGRDVKPREIKEGTGGDVSAPVC